MTDAFREEADLPLSAEGLFVADVDQASEAYDKGLRPGSIIEKAGRVPVNTIDDFEAQIEAAKEMGRKSILLLVRDAGSPRFLALSVEE